MNHNDFLGKYELRDLAREPLTDDNRKKYPSGKACSSVKYSDGIYYSYGSHYPLMWEINGLTFINVRGYSNSTAKHVNHARSNAPADYIGVNLRGEGGSRQYQAASLTWGNMKLSFLRDIEALESELDGLKRHGTIREKNLLDTLEQKKNVLARLNAIE